MKMDTINKLILEFPINIVGEIFAHSKGFFLDVLKKINNKIVDRK
jgi:hypothetical protein